MLYAYWEDELYDCNIILGKAFIIYDICCIIHMYARNGAIISSHQVIFLLCHTK